MTHYPSHKRGRAGVTNVALTIIRNVRCCFACGCRAIMASGTPAGRRGIMGETGRPPSRCGVTGITRGCSCHMSGRLSGSTYSVTRRTSPGNDTTMIVGYRLPARSTMARIA